MDQGPPEILKEGLQFLGYERGKPGFGGGAVEIQKRGAGFMWGSQVRTGPQTPTLWNWMLLASWVEKGPR